jgi:hypothetical protein
LRRELLTPMYGPAVRHCAIAGEGLIESNRRAPDAFFLFFELPASRYREIYYGQGRK